MNNKTTLIAFAGFGVGLAVGAVTTYLTVKKTFQDRANRDIASVKETYAKLTAMEKTKPNFVRNPGNYFDNSSEEEPIFTEDEKQELIIEGQNILDNQGYWASIQEKASHLPVPEPEFPVGYFTDHQLNPEPGPEDKIVEFKVYEPVEGMPYVISREDYEENLGGYDRLALTYYDGDDTLCDINGSVVDDKDRFVGIYNLDYFGHASDDPNVVYIRNERVGVEYEVFFHKGEYAVVELGLDDEDLGRAPKKNRPMKMRNDD